MLRICESSLKLLPRTVSGSCFVQDSGTVASGGRAGAGQDPEASTPRAGCVDAARPQQSAGAQNRRAPRASSTSGQRLLTASFRRILQPTPAFRSCLSRQGLSLFHVFSPTATLLLDSPCWESSSKLSSSTCTNSGISAATSYFQSPSVPSHHTPCSALVPPAPHPWPQTRSPPSSVFSGLLHGLC